jgi:transposase
MLVRYMEPYIPEYIQGIEDLDGKPWRITKELFAIKNRIRRWISIYYPEFTVDWEGKAAMLILKECPTPAKIIEKGVDGIIAIWKEHKI